MGEHLAADIDSCLRWLRHGDDRAKPRSAVTVSEHSRRVAPVAHAWTTRYQHLREITPDPRHALRDGTHEDTGRSAVAVRLPAPQQARLQRSDQSLTARAARRAVLLPLTEQDYQNLSAACTIPMHDLVLALAGVHAASPHQIRHLLLEDIDVGDRRLLIGTVERHLDVGRLSCPSLLRPGVGGRAALL